MTKANRKQRRTHLQRKVLGSRLKMIVADEPFDTRKQPVTIDPRDERTGEYTWGLGDGYTYGPETVKP